MAELLINTYGPVNVFEHTGGQYIARCTVPGCKWQFILWSRRDLLTLAGHHGVGNH